MNKRIRKKWLKKQGLYVSNDEVWDLDNTICRWIIPRLKKFKELNCAYPGREPYETPEKWDEAIDKIIFSFQLASRDPLDDFAYTDKIDWERYKEHAEEYQKQIEEGLEIFAKWFNYLWI